LTLKRLSVLSVCFLVAIAIASQLRKPAMISDKPMPVHFEEEKKVDQPDKFLEYHRGIRTRDGESGPAYSPNQKWNELTKARVLSAARRKSSGRAKNGDVEFVERGPANVPGRTRALLNVPGDPNDNTWLAGSATGGIWRTTDGGSTWVEVSKDFPALPISSFATNQAGTVIYAGTGEFVSSVFSAVGNGIYKSTDKGITWSPIVTTENNPDFSIITRLITNPANADVILATTTKSNLVGGNSFIMRTTDGGNSWTKVNETTGALEQIIATPGNFNILYASENGVGVWKSTDAGINWNLSNNGMSPQGRVEISVSPVTPAKLFASAVGVISGTNSDLYYSSNAGVSWSLVDVRFNNTAVDFHQGQGFYDNTILCDPFDDTRVYVGGVSLFRVNLTTGSTAVDNFKMTESGTTSFMFLQSFSNIAFDNARLTVGDFNDDIEVEVRFGAGESQKAHRFLVPDGTTSGVAATNYSYSGYITVPFEVWDVTNNRQLMVSFRDQNRNNVFDLVPQALQTTDPPLANSREYVYIHNVDYSGVGPNSLIAVAGGQEHRLMYNFFPALAPGATWNEATLPTSKLIIENNLLQKFNAITLTAADGRNTFDGKNKSDQVNLHLGVHPDHHFMIPINLNATAKTYRILLANDGGVFVSKVSATPGITQGDWEFKGNGLNTTQFYGADKSPGESRYIGGSQDNGTRISPPIPNTNALTTYSYAIGGDGFEVLWHGTDRNKIMGTIYNGEIHRSVNAGATWAQATAGFTPSATEFSFITRLANSKTFPDRVFTVGTSGVYVSNDFGGQWNLRPIATKWVIGTPFYLDAEVSRANSNIVWAGSGMNNSGTLRSLHVSIDGGSTFTATNNFTTVPLGNITKLASHATQPNTAYALFSFANAPKVLRTTDLGQTWEDISGFGSGSSSANGFPDVAVYCLYVRTDNPDVLWVGTEIGIVESLDNGQTWALRDDFPNVSVWDMKGQDNEVVIATHGRGIWSAILDEVQQPIPLPEIIASGTSPQEHLMLRLQSPMAYDSLEVTVGTTKLPAIEDISNGTFDVDISGVTPGEKEIKLTSYVDGVPFESVIKKVNQIDILPIQDTYATYFGVLTDLIVDGLTLQFFENSGPNDRLTLQTNHNYLLNKDHSVFLRTPVTVSSTLPTLFYGDIAIIEPGKDSIVVEATKNGLDWIPLRDSYDAAFVGDNEGDWLTAYNNQAKGARSMFVNHEVDISEQFEAGDVLLFRFRMVSDQTVSAWGWAIDYISIQEIPLDVSPSAFGRPVVIYPNPSQGNFTVDYTLHAASEVMLTVTDVTGRTLQKKNLGHKSGGLFSEVVSVAQPKDGTYLVIIDSKEGKKIGKVVIRN
jgi:hypothetical protein